MKNSIINQINTIRLVGTLKQIRQVIIKIIPHYLYILGILELSIIFLRSNRDFTQGNGIYFDLLGI